jgi:hypothetical protein
MPGLATVTYASVSTVTSRGLSATQPCETKPESGLSVMALNACLATFLLFFRHSPVSRRLVARRVRLYVLSRHSALLAGVSLGGLGGPRR